MCANHSCVSSLSCIELPWDAPTFECTEFLEWTKQNYFFTPWSKISNEPLGTVCVCMCVCVCVCVCV